MKHLITILLLLITTNTFAEYQLFNKANELYAQAKYDNAIILYDSILKKGLESSELYNNLGNCYFKKQEWANAIWHFEKSLKYKYTEKTAQNLALTNLKITDNIKALPILFYKKWWNNTINIFNTKNWQILTLLLIWILFFIIQFKKINTGYNQYFMSILFTTIIILFFISNSSFNKRFKNKDGIIFSPNTVVKSAPSSSGNNLFQIHSGVKVEITDSIENWLNIQIVNGNSGWIKKSDCKQL